MSEKKSDTIKKRLSSFPPEVSKLALSAVELSEHAPEASVSEQLESELRRIIRERKATQ